MLINNAYAVLTVEKNQEVHDKMYYLKPIGTRIWVGRAGVFAIMWAVIMYWALA